MIRKMFLCFFIFVWCFQPSLAQEEKPLLTIVIPSLEQAIQHIGEVADRFIPGMGSNLAPMLEQSLPPGTYQKIQKNLPLVVLVYTPIEQAYGNAFYVALPLTEDADPAQLFGTNPEFKKIGIHTVFGEPGSIARIQPNALMLENLKGDLCVQVQFGENWKKFLEELGTMIPNTKQDPVVPWIGDFLQVLLKMTQSVTEQVEWGQFSLFFSGEAVSFDFDVSFIPGSQLAQFAQASANQTMDTFILPTENAQMLMQINLPQKELEQLLKSVADFVGQFDLSENVKKIITDYLSVVGPYYSNGQMTLQFNAEAGMQFVYLCKGFNLERYREISLQMQQINWSSLFQGSTNMEMKFSQEYQENVRQSGTVPIHLQTIHIRFEGPMADLQNTMIEQMYGKGGMKLELAEIAPYIVMSSQSSAEAMDKVIKLLSTPTTNVSPSAKILSFELDVLKYYQSIFEMMQGQMPPPIRAVIEKLKELGPQEKCSFEVTPIEQGFNHHGRIPLAPFVNVFNLVQEKMGSGTIEDVNSIPPPEITLDEDPEEDNLAPYVGQSAPNLIGKDLAGENVSLDAYRGKVVILDFWATWCPPCVKEIPGFIRLQERYKDQGLVVIGVTDEELAEVKDFVKENKINYPILCGYLAEIEPYNLVMAIPTTFIIDREGVIRAIHTGFTSEEKFEAEILPYLTPGGLDKK